LNTPDSAFPAQSRTNDMKVLAANSTEFVSITRDSIILQVDVTGSDTSALVCSPNNHSLIIKLSRMLAPTLSFSTTTLEAQLQPCLLRSPPENPTTTAGSATSARTATTATTKTSSTCSKLPNASASTKATLPAHTSTTHLPPTCHRHTRSPAVFARRLCI
jgi:hypothetical protein